MSLASKLSITDVDLKGKRVLIRVRFPPTCCPAMPMEEGYDREHRQTN